MTRCPALDYENTEVVIMQTDAKTFADKFPYPICNLCEIMALYSLLYQRLTKFMTSTSLSAEKEPEDESLPVFLYLADVPIPRTWKVHFPECRIYTKTDK